MYRLPEHVGNWVIANIVADPNAAAEKFDGNVLRFSVVDEDTVLFLGRKDHRDVGFWFGLQRWHLNVRTVLGKADACQKFATLSWRDKRRLVNKTQSSSTQSTYHFTCVTGCAFANVVSQSLRLEADAVLAVVLLARGSLWV